MLYTKPVLVTLKQENNLEASETYQILKEEVIKDKIITDTNI